MWYSNCWSASREPIRKAADPVRRITREDLLDEIENGAEVIRRPAFERVHAPPPPAVECSAGQMADQFKTIADGQRLLVETIKQCLDSMEVKPKRLHVKTYRNANDELEADITVVE